VESKLHAPLKPLVEKQVLDQLDIRIGTIEAVTEVPGSEKLVELRVDFGDHKRSILVGMKGERAEPAEVESKQALFVINLKPRKMAGRLSEGLLLDIGYAEGLVPVLAVPERPVPNGARAG